ncbi:conserved hypothetical protein [Leishmania mexicana MHOM/GT/2001/U1103]|uniref:Uncharacterized protein n=1 Tax=Leishmania mexicana (strain MHOM/GT/2001/U1103) TaxID=929439 RepID=E9AS90_LEIMU|nr:conserved hypothetical protein [Leishmania mexicana MHOM/GT/2001/U1103]CBZ25811.1 conserved hypothetical protein [Leishmania mexicana MHOM/GT/2001/U1103]
MFGRRVFASAPLPRHMWAKMHIQNAAQAQRILPSLAPLVSSLGRSTNVLNSQALAQARDGMASDSSATSLEELSVRYLSGSLTTVSSIVFGPVKFTLSVSTPLVSFLELLEQMRIKLMQGRTEV